MFFSVQYRWLPVLLCGIVCARHALAGPVILQNATATYSQGSGGPFLVSNAIDGSLTTGWAVLSNAAVAAFETQSSIGYATGTELTFVLDHQYGGNHNLGRFRLSITTDDRDDFADGKQAVDGADPGDVTANWTVLLPTSMVSSGGATFTRPTDGAMVVTGTNSLTDKYTITALTNLTGITGVRLEVLKDSLDPPTIGPGRAGSNNFVLTDFRLAESQYTGPPQWNVDTDGNWSDAGNWVGGTPNAVGATAEFRGAITAPRTVTVDSPATVGTIHFDNANAYTIAGTHAVTLEGLAGTAAINVTGGNHAIHAPLMLNDPTTVQVASGSTLSALGGIGGIGGIAKQGGGVLVVGQASYGGATVIEQGTLQLSNSVAPGSLPTSTAVQIGASGTFDLNGNNQTVASLADYGGAGGMVTNSHTAPATLTVGTTTGTTTFGGVIADGIGGMSLVKTGDSTQVLTGANTFTGGTTVEQGTLQLVGTNSAVGAVRGTVTVLPDGVLQLSGGHSLGHGLTTRVHTLNINGGLVENIADAPEGWGITINLTGGTLQSNNGVASTSALSHFSLGGPSGGTGSVVNSLASSDTSVISGRIHLREGNPDNRLAFHVADGAAAVDLLVSAAITENAAGYRITKTGIGTLQLTGVSTYTGGTVVEAGTLTLSGAGRLGNGNYGGPIAIGENAVLNFNMTNSQNLSGPITGTGTLAQNTTASYLYMTGDHSGFEGTFHNMAGNMYLASAAANSPANADVQVDGGAMQLGFNGAPSGTWTIGSLSGTGGVVHPNNNLAGKTVTLEVGGLDSDTTYGGILRNNTNATPSVLALTKVGAGVLTLTATNTYTGGTTAQDGILEVAATRALGSGPIAINGGTVRLATNAYNALGTPEPAITIEPGGVLTANNTANNAHNLGALTLNGGTLSSNNVENAHGNFILNSGVTAGGTSMSTISATAVSLRNTGGTFNVADATEGTDLLVLSRVINHPGLAGALTKTGAGTLELAGANTYTGGTTVDAGTLLVSNTTGSGTGSGAVSVNLDATLGGTGRIGGHVNINADGSLAPGESVGTLYLDGGNLTFNPNAFFDVDIDAVAVADLVHMGGGSLSPNNATIRVNLGFRPELGDSWTILAGEASRNGIFNEDVLVTSGSELLDGWKRFDVGYGNSVTLTVVPEPGTCLLLFASLVGGLLVRRRR